MILSSKTVKSYSSVATSTAIANRAAENMKYANTMISFFAINNDIALRIVVLLSCF